MVDHHLGGDLGPIHDPQPRFVCALRATVARQWVHSHRQYAFDHLDHYLIDNLRFLPAPSNGCNGLPNGTACSDSNACTTGDTCQSNTCKPGTAVTCVALDQCRNVGTGAGIPALGVAGTNASEFAITPSATDGCTATTSLAPGALVITHISPTAGRKDEQGGPEDQRV